MGWLMIIFGTLFLLGAISPGDYGVSRAIWVVVGLPLVHFGYKRAFAKKIADKSAKDEFNSLAFVKGADYSNVYGDTGIAINKSEKKVLLASAEHVKLYDFSQIKSWRYELNTGGFATGGGLAGVGLNVAQNRLNQVSSGFFVVVKDIDYPEWRVAFDPSSKERSPKQEMLRWMEIFDQYVNRNA
jgi:hypothetical protein